MQNTLVQRYLGNKTSIASSIVKVVSRFAEEGDLVLDAFSGSLATSAAFRGAGFEVACNDISHFSWTFANAYFSGHRIPEPPTITIEAGRAIRTWDDLVAELTQPYPESFPLDVRGTHIYDAYCEDGRNSSFTSSRGSSGKRRFFSPANATLIDRALSRIRHWSRTNALSERERCVLTAILISGVEKISNTQGTYHDFPRDFIDERAKRTLSLKLPDTRVFDGIPSRFIGRAQDSLQFVKEIPDHKVLYLDPPYNFRQYTSYYFMLNLLSEYAEIPDLESYFKNIKFVRGQNMESDFNSSFSRKTKFLNSLKEVIERSKSKYVVLSYFDGRNHWGNFKNRESEATGNELIADLFHSDLFQPGTFERVQLDRLNYQSYGGHAAAPIQELLFVAKRRQS